ncbi:unnamed protein product [Ectocarpus fasciculatus]
MALYKSIQQQFESKRWWANSCGAMALLLLPGSVCQHVYFRVVVIAFYPGYCTLLGSPLILGIAGMTLHHAYSYLETQDAVQHQENVADHSLKKMLIQNSPFVQPCFYFDGLGQHYYMYGEYAEYSRLLGMDGRLLNPEGYADYVSGRGFCIGQMGSKGREVSLQDLLGPGSIQSKLAALCSTFHGPGWLSYCILGARRWLGQLLPLVGDLLLPPTGKHGSLNALPVWFIGAMAASVSADHVTPRDSATSGVANGEATASYCHHKWGCFEFTLAVFTVGVVLFGVCCRSSLRACAQRVRQRARASSDIGAVLPTRAAPDARSMFFCGMSFWGIVVHGER